MGEPNHHRRALGLRWSYWQWGIVRSAGFPAGPLEALALPRTSRLVQGMLVAQEAERVARSAALGALDELSNPALAPGRSRALTDLAKRVDGGRPLGEAAAAVRALSESAYGLLTGWEQAHAAASEAITEAKAAYLEELREARARLREQLADDRLQEAVGWQSPFALEGIRKLVNGGDVETRAKKTRQRELVGAMYVQRYRVKNDTVGFFGPREIASVGDSDGSLTCVLAADPIDRIEVFLEHWSMVALARRIAADPEVVPRLRPIRSGWIRLDGAVLHYPVGGRSDLEPSHARLLGMADGETTVRRMEEALVGDGPEDFGDMQTLRSTLRALERRHLMCTVPVVPTCVLRPDRHLRAELERLLDGAVLDRWIGMLDELERLRLGLETARGAHAVGAARDELDRWFEDTTSSGAYRSEGETYGARQVAYVDCAGSRKVDVGREVLGRMAPVELVYQTLRTYSARVWASFEPELVALHDRLAEQVGPNVEWPTFVSAALEEVLRVDTCLEVADDLRAGWRHALSYQDGERRVERDLESVRAGLAPWLADDPPGWLTARFHTTDVMLRATGAEAVAAGEYQIVVGEIHPLRNMVFYPVALSLHPEVMSEAAAAFAADAPGLVRPNIPAASMMRAAQYLPPDLVPVTMIDGSWPPPRCDRERLVRAGALIVRRTGDASLVVAARDGGFSAPLGTALASYAGAVAGSIPLHMLTGPHTPRVTVGGVVLFRESWTVGAPEGSADADGYLAARRWAASHGMPRHVFVRTRVGSKPFFVDLDNPFLVEALLKEGRRGTELGVSEMLPTPDELWMPDAQGRRYTSELRLCAVDPLAPEGASRKHHGLRFRTMYE